MSRSAALPRIAASFIIAGSLELDDNHDEEAASWPETMSDYDVYVNDSPIHGKGLFAKNFIPAGAVIGTLRGEYASTDGDYVLWLNDNTGFLVQCQFRYINHSDTPNAAYYDDLQVCAIRDIQPGEEITHQYQSDWQAP